MGKKADLIAAMPVGSTWDGSCALSGGVSKPMGLRRVDKHRSADIQFHQTEKNTPSFLQYPKKEDIVDIQKGGETIILKFKNEEGRIWSEVTYKRVN